MDLVVSDRFFNPVYIPYAGASQRYQFFYGGSSSGKSAFVATRIVLDAVIGRNTLCLRQHANRIPTSCFAEIVKAIDRMEARHLYTINQNAITSTLSGGQILFSGLDDEEKIKSISPASGPLTDVWVEEATEITYAAFKQLDKRLRGLSPHKKRLTCTFNPSNRSHWLYTKYFDALGDEAHLLVRFHRAGARNDLETAAAKLYAVDIDDRIGGMELAVGVLIGLADAANGFHDIQRRQKIDIHAGGVADKAENRNVVAL